MRELVEGSMEMLRDIEGVSERSRLIAFNLAVEAARIGRQGQGIKVIVHELSSINDKIIAFSKAVALRLKENRDLGVMIADRQGNETGILAEKVEDGRVSSERALERLIGKSMTILNIDDSATMRKIALDLGANDFLAKPFQKDQLLATVKKVTGAWLSSNPCAPYPAAANSAIFIKTRTFADNADIRLSPGPDCVLRINGLSGKFPFLVQG